MFLGILCFSSIVIVESFLNRNRPITVLGTEVSVEFMDETGADVRIFRTQYLRANHEGVTAYFMEVWAAFGGTVPREQINVDAFIGSNQITTVRLKPWQSQLLIVK